MLRRRIAVLLFFAILAAGGVIAYRVYRTRTFFEPHALLSRFPAEDATVLSVDVAALRRAGLLNESKVPLESDYRQFLEGTGFNYKTDLDSVTAAFSGSGNFFIARGRFNWKKIRAYTARAGGSCYRELCRVQGSTPERHISFLPLRDDAMGLAVGANDLAAARLSSPSSPIAAELPSATVWLSVPGTRLRQQNALPHGLRPMLSALQSTDRILLTLVSAANGIEAHLETTCRTENDARILASELRTTTTTLKEALAQQKETAQDELGAALSAGKFDQNDRRVTGTWPIPKTLLDSLTSGI